MLPTFKSLNWCIYLLYAIFNDIKVKKNKKQQYFGIETRPSTQDTSTVQVPVALSSILKNENIQTQLQ